MDKLLSSFNSLENSDEIEFPLLIFTGGFSESVVSIIFMKSSQELNELINLFKSLHLVFLNLFFKGLIVFKDSFRLYNSLGVIFLVAIFDTNLSISLKDESISQTKFLCSSSEIK